MTGHDDDGYHGPATLVLDGRDFAVHATLAGVFQPLDGRYHWYGRLTAPEELVELLTGTRRTALLRTPDGSAEGRIGDADVWGRYRITGTSTPPFHVPHG
ncbi:MAG TPA: DUF4873 domain-containing protein [Rugosimonospora sp.]|nr:DUF4873 domain-containing protein [Rugosimonospora sp.]